MQRWHDYGALFVTSITEKGWKWSSDLQLCFPPSTLTCVTHALAQPIDCCERPWFGGIQNPLIGDGFISQTSNLININRFLTKSSRSDDDDVPPIYSRQNVRAASATKCLSDIKCNFRMHVECISRELIVEFVQPKKFHNSLSRSAVNVIVIIIWSLAS